MLVGRRLGLLATLGAIGLDAYAAYRVLMALPIEANLISISLPDGTTYNLGTPGSVTGGSGYMPPPMGPYQPNS